MTDVTELLAGWRKLADSVDGWAYSDSREDEAFSRDARESFARLLDAVQAVRTLHQPDPRPTCQCRECSLTNLSHDECAVCHVPWPCQTVRAINDALTTTGDTND